MRRLLLLSLLTTLLLTLGSAVFAGCGDDPGFSDLPYPYPPDAAYDVVDAPVDG